MIKNLILCCFIIYLATKMPYITKLLVPCITISSTISIAAKVPSKYDLDPSCKCLMHFFDKLSIVL